MSKLDRWGRLSIYDPDAQQPQARTVPEARRWQAVERHVQQPRLPSPGATPPPKPSGTGKSATVGPHKAAVTHTPTGATDVTKSVEADLAGRESEPSGTHAETDVRQAAEPAADAPDGLVSFSVDMHAHALSLAAATPTSAAPEARQGTELLDYLSSMVCAFCNQSVVRDSEGWSISIRLNSRILSETTLHLKLTQMWLILRFQCADKADRDLLSMHQRHLAAVLEAAVAPRREVIIEID